LTIISYIVRENLAPIIAVGKISNGIVFTC
jgi:hypothetical protein